MAASAPIGPVPGALIPFFRAGGIKELLYIAEEIGTGLRFFNELRRRYPRDPRMSGQEYNGLLSYLNSTAREGLKAGNALNFLEPGDSIPLDIIPKNYFLRSKNPLTDRYLVKFQHTTINETLGTTQDWTVLDWYTEGETVGDILQRIMERTQEHLDRISTSNKAGTRYRLDVTSITFIAAFRR